MTGAPAAVRVFVIVLLWSAWSSASPAPPGAASEDTAHETPQADELTTDVRGEPDASVDVPRLFLDLPRLITELAFLPFYPAVWAAERWQLPDRIFDLVTNDERTLAVLPIIDFFSAQTSVGFGFALLHNDPLGSPDRTVVIGILETNGDRDLSVFYVRRLPKLNGRRISLGASYSVDSDVSYYGLGADRELEIERMLRVDAVDAEAGMTLAPSGKDLDAGVGLAFRHRELRSGEGPKPGLQPDDLISAPVGFGASRNYPEVSAYIVYDSRDAIGRTTRGLQARLEGVATHDLDRGDSGGFRATGKITAFLPVLPLNRVLAMTVGASAAFPVAGSDDDIPFHHLVHLGGEDVLRSYPESRFVDRLGWWAIAEYRYEIYEYAATGNGLSAVLFFDVGNVGRDPDDLFTDSVPWSAGFALRVEASLLLLGRLQLAAGPEGVRVSVGVGELP